MGTVPFILVVLRLSRFYSMHCICMKKRKLVSPRLWLDVNGQRRDVGGGLCEALGERSVIDVSTEPNPASSDRAPRDIYAVG